MQGRRLKELIEKKGFNKEAFANKVGVHRIYLQQVFNNKIIPLKFIVTIAPHLRLTPEELIKTLNKPIPRDVRIIAKDKKIKQLEEKLKKVLRQYRELKAKMNRDKKRQIN